MLGLAWSGTSIIDSLPLIQITSWGGCHACARFCSLCATSALKSLVIIWIILLRYDLEKFWNILVCSNSILKSFGTIWFVPLRSLKVLEQFGPFHFDPEKFVKFLARFIIDPQTFWNNPVRFIFTPKSFRINFFDPPQS